MYGRIIVLDLAPFIIRIDSSARVEEMGRPTLTSAPATVSPVRPSTGTGVGTIEGMTEAAIKDMICSIYSNCSICAMCLLMKPPPGPAFPNRVNFFMSNQTRSARARHPTDYAQYQAGHLRRRRRAGYERFPVRQKKS